MTLEDVRTYAEKKSNIVIYGAGELGKVMLEILREWAIPVKAFLVSDGQPIPQAMVSGMPVYTLSNWLEMNAGVETGILVSVAPSYQDAVKAALEQSGISDYLLVHSFLFHEPMRRLHPVNAQTFLETLDPVSRGFGSERGTPLDRVYIERFLEKASMEIPDVRRIIEVGSDAYSRRFFPESTAPVRYDVLRYDQGMDLTRVETLPKNVYDVFVCTQVLNFIYDIKAAIRGAHALLCPGGVLLATVQGCIGQVSRTDMKQWGDYWRFTELGIRKLIAEVFGEKNVRGVPFGNALIATAFVQGVALEDLPDQSVLDTVEPEYAINIGVIARKGI